MPAGKCLADKKDPTGSGPRAGGGGKDARVVSSDAALYAIHTDLTFTNSRMPYSESSRP